MLAKSERLTRAEFTHYFKTGRRIHSPLATLVFASHEQRHGAVVVGKKVAKRAVDRNTLRRRVYATLRHRTEGMTGVFIVILKPAATTVSRAELREAISVLIERVVKNP